MKDSEMIKEYSDRLVGISIKIRLLRSEFSESRIVQKILVSVPQRYESIIGTLENTKDLSNKLLFMNMKMMFCFNGSLKHQSKEEC